MSAHKRSAPKPSIHSGRPVLADSNNSLNLSNSFRVALNGTPYSDNNAVLLCCVVLCLCMEHIYLYVYIYIYIYIYIIFAD